MRFNSCPRWTLGALLTAAALAAPLGHAGEPAWQQWGPLRLGGEIAASIAPEDPAFFNDTGYDSNPLRRASLSLSLSLALGRPAALLFEAPHRQLRRRRASTPSTFG